MNRIARWKTESKPWLLSKSNCGFVLACVFSCLLLAACGQQAVAPQQQLSNSQELMNAWLELPREGPDNLDVASAQTIAQRMQQTPEGLTPLLDLLAQPEADPVAKVLAVITISPHIAPEMAPRLTEMTEPSNEVTTRACATHLLGLVPTEEAKSRVRELLKDPEHRVKTAAAMVLGARGDQEVLATMPEVWQSPETTAEDKDQILFMITEDHLRQNIPVYQDALMDYTIEPKARERLAQMLGRVGDTSVVPLLERAAEEDPHSAVRVMARGAAEALKQRASGAPAAEPVASPAAPPVEEQAPADDVPVEAPVEAPEG